MKVLHFSEIELPDIRVERYALLQTKLGFKPSFCGCNFKEVWFSEKNHFDSYHVLDADPKIRIGVPWSFNRYKNDFSKIYKDLEPDIVHAHNIVTAKVCVDLEIPFVYDDHEYWSQQIAARRKEKLNLLSHRRLTTPLLAMRYNSWEKQVLSNAKSVITVSDTIAEEFTPYNNHVFTIPNFPTKYEISQIPDLQQPSDELSTVFVTKYSTVSERKSVDKVIDLVGKSSIQLSVIGKHGSEVPGVTYHGFKSHMELIELLPKFHAGLPILSENRIRTGYFKYICPNRIFIYTHAGVTPVIHVSMLYLKKLFGDLVPVVENEENLVQLLKKLGNDAHFLENGPKSIQQFSKEHLLFEYSAEKMKEAYKIAMS